MHISFASYSAFCYTYFVCQLQMDLHITYSCWGFYQRQLCLHYQVCVLNNKKGQWDILQVYKISIYSVYCCHHCSSSAYYKEQHNIKKRAQLHWQLHWDSLWAHASIKTVVLTFSKSTNINTADTNNTGRKRHEWEQGITVTEWN